MRGQFDKLLLAGLLVMFCALALHAFHHAGESGLATFATDQAKVFGGALLGLITGHALAASRQPPSAPGAAGGA